MSKSSIDLMIEFERSALARELGSARLALTRIGNCDHDIVAARQLSADVSEILRRVATLKTLVIVSGQLHSEV